MASRIASWAIRRPSRRLLLAASLGACTVLGFAPFNVFPIPVFTLAGLFVLVFTAQTASSALFTGFSFGLGLFGAGISWIYISLHTYGGLPGVLAATATAVFCACLAVFPALFSTAGWHLRKRSLLFYCLSLPSLWVMTEWLRAALFTGFPWLAVGYSQVPNSPLSGYASVVGVLGVTALVAITAGGIAYLATRKSKRTAAVPLVLVTVCVWATGSILQHIGWTTPAAPIRVSLLQGNIPQDRKWRDDEIAPTLDTYLSLLQQSEGDLIVMPETALPVFSDQLSQDFRERISTLMRANNADLIAGIVERSTNEGDTRYYNSAISVGVSPSQAYRKQHLVPFGEYVPDNALFAWLQNLLNIPLASMSPGDATQPPLHLGDQKVAVNICFESAFGEEIVRALPEATILVNMSNLAWFGDSLALAQHLQMGQTRAMETGRYLASATNTGHTAIINERGKILQQGPSHQAFVLTGEVMGMKGATPYVVMGNIPVMLLTAFGIGIALKRA